MNLRNKIIGVLLSISGIFALGSCEDLIFDEMKDCHQGVYVKFYSKTPCDVDSLYPVEINNLNIYIFDANDRYVSTSTINDVTISKDFQFLIPIQTHGKYSFVAWSGIRDHYTLENLQVGETSKDELLLQLKRIENIAENIKGSTLFTGISPYVFLPDPETVKAPFYEYTAINMREYTNRIEVKIEGVEDPQDYEVDIAMRNGDYSAKGDILLNGDILHYPAEYDYADNILSAKFTMLKLETGYNDWLTIKNKNSEETFYQGDFLGTLLLQNPDVNLSCDNDFVIRFVIEDRGSYYSVEIWVNDWLVHSYETEVSGGDY